MAQTNVWLSICKENCINIWIHLNIQIVFTLTNECPNVFPKTKLTWTIVRTNRCQNNRFKQMVDIFFWMIYSNIQIYSSHSFRLNMVIQVNLVMMAKLFMLMNQMILVNLVILVNMAILVNLAILVNRLILVIFVIMVILVNLLISLVIHVIRVNLAIFCGYGKFWRYFLFSWI